MKDLAPWIAIAITLALSIMVPLFTQIANNRFQLKLKRIEKENYDANRRVAAFDEFFCNVGGCVLHAERENICQAGASIQRLYPFLPEELWRSLDELYMLIKKHEWDDAVVKMNIIGRWIATSMKTKQ